MRDQLSSARISRASRCRPPPSLRATQDSIRALMLIRAYRVMGHLAADLDPLGARRPQGAHGAEARDLRLHGGRSRPPDLHRSLSRSRDGDDPADAQDPAPHLLPAHRLPVHAHHLAGAEVVDPAARRGRGEGHPLHRRGQARHPQQADRSRSLREILPTSNTPAPSASASMARNPCVPALEQIIKRGGQLGVQRHRHRHGAPRPSQRPRQRHVASRIAPSSRSSRADRSSPTTSRARAT